MLFKESETLELKKSTSELKEATISIVAILNKHQKGELYFGIRNNGQVIGQDVTNKTLRDISQSISSNIEPKIFPKINEVVLNKKKCIKVEFSGKNIPYYACGRAYIRVGDEDRQLSAKEVEEMIIKKNRENLHWDEEICKEATLKDLDEKTVKWFLRKAKIERRLEIDEATPVKEALKRFHLIKNNHLTKAAILLFGKNPQRFFSQAEVRCARFKGTEPLEFIDMKVFGKNIIVQRQDAVEFVKEHIKLHAKIVGTEREERWEYPIEAVREAITNAICHRDYELTSNVQVRIFDDRIEVWGAGPLPKPLTIEDLKKKHDSVLRNVLIGKCFFMINFIEQWGTGTNRIIKECLKHGLPEPLFEELAGTLVVNFRKYKISEEIMKGLSKEEKVIINFIKENGKISRKECVKLLNISPTTAFRHFKSLENKKVIKKVGKGKNIYYVLA